MRVKAQFCDEIEDPQLIQNCLNYNVSPNCFFEHFGNKGLEIGELADDSTTSDYKTCFLDEIGYFEKKNKKKS